MSISAKQVIQYALRGYLQGSGGPGMGTNASPDPHALECLLNTQERALARCKSIGGFDALIPVIGMYLAGECFWEVGRKECGSFIGALAESLKEEPFYPTLSEIASDEPLHPFFVPAAVAARRIGISLQAISRRKLRGKIPPECMSTQGQRLWIRSDWVFDEATKEAQKRDSEKKSKKVAA